VSGQLDGPRLQPVSGRAARQLVVLVHGYGADGNDLIGLGREWARVLPDAAFVSPHGPERCPASPSGYQWFALNRIDPDEVATGARNAGPLLERFIAAELSRLGLPDTALALVGFSQGTMMALHVGLRRARPPAALVGYSGALAAPETLAREITARPPVLLVHGDADQVVPLEALYLAAAALGGLEVPVEWHVRSGVGHGIDGPSIAMGGTFLADGFAAAGLR
jgi:phospholipase/carboxylesterase